MKKIVKLIAIMLVGIFVLATFSAAGPAQASADETGFQFLDRLVVILAKAAAPGGGSVDIDQNILLLAKELKSARDAKRVDDLFAVRYSRLLSAVRQAVLRDPEVLYWPMYRKAGDPQKLYGEKHERHRGRKIACIKPTGIGF